jgi:hypothetical protein
VAKDLLFLQASLAKLKLPLSYSPPDTVFAEGGYAEGDSHFGPFYGRLDGFFEKEVIEALVAVVNAVPDLLRRVELGERAEHEVAVHDALVAAAALPGAGASGEQMVAAVKRKGVADGMAIMHTIVGGVLRILATDDGIAMLLRALEEHREGRPVTLEFDLLAGDDAIAKARREGAPETTATSFGGIASDAEVSRG